MALLVTLFSDVRTVDVTDISANWPAASGTNVFYLDSGYSS